MRRLTRFGPLWVGALWLLAVDLSPRTLSHHRTRRLDVLHTQATQVVDIPVPVNKPGIGELIPVEGPSGAKFLR